MPKRERDDSVVVDLNALPDPLPQGRKAVQVLKKEQLEQALASLADGWPEGEVKELLFNPLNLSLKWKVKEVRLLDSALRGVSSTLKLLDLNPSGCNNCLPGTISATIVSQCTGLHTLRIREIPMAPETTAILGGLTDLRELHVGGIAVSIKEPIGMSGFRSLKACPGLQTLHAESTEVEDKALVELVSGCEHLTDVDLTSSKRLTEQGLTELATRCPGLKRLILLNCEAVGPSGVRALAGCTQLEELNLQRVRGATTALREVARCCVRLKQLFLCACFLTDDDITALPSLTALQTLDLNGAKGYGAAALRESVPSMSPLSDLSLNSLAFPSHHMDAVVHALASGPMTALTRLDLNNTEVTAVAVATLRDARPGCRVSTMHCPKCDGADSA